MLHPAHSHVVGQDPGDVALGDPAVRLEVGAEVRVALGVKLAVVPGKDAKVAYVALHLDRGGGGKVQLVGEMERRRALQRIVLELFVVHIDATSLELDAELRIPDQLPVIGLGSKIVPVELGDDRLSVGPPDPRRSADGHDEGDDGDSQQHAEYDFEVVLKLALDPGNHGEKESDATAAHSRGKPSLSLL